MPRDRRSRIARNPLTPKERGKKGAHVRKIREGLRRARARRRQRRRRRR